MIRLFCCLAVLVALVVPASADIVMNGQFLTGTNSPGAFENLGIGSTVIDHWSVTAGNVDWIGTYWQQQPAGGQSMDLDGLMPGAISQNIATVAGQTYFLSFWLAGNPANQDPTQTLKTLEVTAGNASQIFTFDTAGHSTAGMGWVPRGISFTATGPSTTITFASKDVSGDYGPALADVSVPGPDFYTEFAVGLSGLGLLIFARRKRQA
jgi:choice-of-anchor C domain-containing protein